VLTPAHRQTGGHFSNSLGVNFSNSLGVSQSLPRHDVRPDLALLIGPPAGRVMGVWRRTILAWSATDGRPVFASCRWPHPLISRGAERFCPVGGALVDG
jgi:hypothetical protein